MNDVIATYTALRNDMEATFHRSYEHAVRVAKSVDVEAEIPRIAARQRHRANAPTATVEEHFRVNMAIPFLDHIIAEITEQFSGMVIYKFFSFILYAI